MREARRDPAVEKDHGAHTLKVWCGTVVGVYGNDVFVELGPRMQGVIARREFTREPRVGERFDFTLRGREDGLWALERREAASLRSWEDMEPGVLVHARAIGALPEGLELKIGKLHAFMPKSHTGLARDQKASVLVGKVLTCEVIEVDRERQRVLVSRKLVLQRERGDDRQREVGALLVGQTIEGRVARLEPYGAFIAFGRGLEGLVHVSNVSYERVEHPAKVLRLGELVRAKVLALRAGGSRIALGLKQLQESPWRSLTARLGLNRVVEGTVKRVMPFGAFIAILPGIEGLVHNTQAELCGEKNLSRQLQPGERVSVRVLAIDEQAERLELSLLHEDGRAIGPDEAEANATFATLKLDARPSAASTALSRALAQALRARNERATTARPGA
ncbi:MAG: 30S ribosomal protein S1 [Planctomycetes bacterium]|nr:30S ribosomal protein S1 [Planctomycetota bacterium]